MSSIGPNTRKPKTGTSENRAINDRPITASEEEHKESKKARAIMINKDTAIALGADSKVSFPPSLCKSAENAAPTIKYFPTPKNSSRACSKKACTVLRPPFAEAQAAQPQSPPPKCSPGSSTFFGARIKNDKPISAEQIMPKNTRAKTIRMLPLKA